MSPLNAADQVLPPHEAPDVVAMVTKMNVGLEPLNQTLAWAGENAIGDDWERAVVHCLRTYDDRWQGWVTPEAYKRISEALEED